MPPLFVIKSWSNEKSIAAPPENANSDSGIDWFHMFLINTSLNYDICCFPHWTFWICYIYSNFSNTTLTQMHKSHAIIFCDFSHRPSTPIPWYSVYSYRYQVRRRQVYPWALATACGDISSARGFWCMAPINSNLIHWYLGRRLRTRWLCKWSMTLLHPRAHTTEKQNTNHVLRKNKSKNEWSYHERDFVESESIIRLKDCRSS